ncbi:MAG: alpha/beta fold hydrolase [Actinomycetota bacterium]
MAAEATNPPEPVTIRSSGGAELHGRLIRSSTADRRKSVAVLFLHGFPSADLWADKIGNDLTELCERIAADQQWNALTIHFRGCGESTGDFSLTRWVDDASAAIRFLRAETNPTGLWVCGFGTGGAVGLVAAAEDPAVSGVAVAASPADFDDWAARPERLLGHAREVGVITSPGFPKNQERWNAELKEVRAVEAAEQLTPRPLLVLHGSEDEAVPHFDARMVADAHGGADLRFIHGAGHDLRHDPRAVAVLLGWLNRQSVELSER